MSDAAATLSLKIDTGNAAVELGTLKTSYEDLKTAFGTLGKGAGGLEELQKSLGKASSRIVELEATVKTAQAELSKLEAKFKAATDQITGAAEATKRGTVELVDGMVTRTGRALTQYQKIVVGTFETLSKEMRASAATTKSQIEALTAKPQGLAEMRAYYLEIGAQAKASVLETVASLKAQEQAEAASSVARLKVATAARSTRQKTEEEYTSWWASELQKRERAEQLSIAAAVKELKAQERAELTSNATRLKAATAVAAARAKSEEAYSAWWQAELMKRERAEQDRILRSVASLKAQEQAEAASSAARLHVALKDIEARTKAEAAYTAWWQAELAKRDRALTISTSAVNTTPHVASTRPTVAGFNGLMNTTAPAAQVAPTTEQEVASLGAAMTRLGASTHTATEHQHHWNNAANEAHALARGLSGSLGTLWMTYGSIAPLLAGAAIGAAFVQAAKQGSEFAYQLTFVKALSGETAESIRGMSQAALTLGGNSLYGPGEIASGFRVLAQAGVKAKDSIAAMIPVLDLATVGEMSMEQASTTLVGVMNAFSLPTSSLEHIGDVFAKAAAESQTSVQAMTEAMKTASVVGEQYGATMEDTATALTLLAKVNISGTAAGTSLRNMLKELYSPTKQAENVFKTLGLATSDTEGKLRSFADIIYDLRGKLEDYDKASQVKILQGLFGERGAKEAVVMLSQTRDEWDKLNGTISASGKFMREVSAELEATAKGTFLQAINTLKSGFIGAFDATEGPLKALAVQMKTAFSSPELKASIVSVVELMANLTSGVMSLIPIVTAAASAVSALTPVLVGAGVALLTITSTTSAIKLTTLAVGALGAMASPVGGVAMAVGAVVTAFVALQAKTPDSIIGINNFNAALDTQITKLQIVNAELQKKLLLSGGGVAGGEVDQARQELRKYKQQVNEYQRRIDAYTASGSTVWERNLAHNPLSGDDGTRQKYKEYAEAIGNITGLKKKLEDATLKVAIAEGYEIENTRKGGQVMAAELIKQQELLDKIKVGDRKYVAPGNEPKGAAAAENDAYAAQMTALQNFITGYESEYKQFTSDTQKMQNEGHVSELQMIQMNGSARITSITNQMEKEQAAIALAKSKGKLGDVESHKGKLAALDADRIRAATDTDNKLLEAKSKFSDEMLKLDIAYNGRAETELMKAGTQLKGKWSELMNEALRDGNEEAQQALAKTAENMLISADFKDQFNKVKLQVSDFTSEISALEADMGRDGGWMARILGTEAIYEQIEKAKVQISSQMEELRAKLSLMNPGDEAYSRLIKQFTQLRREYDKVANYVPQVWKDITKSIDGTVHDAFSKIFTKGKTDWKSFGRSISDNLKTQLLDALYQVTVRKWVFNIVANVVGGAGSSLGLTGGSSSGNALSSLFGLGGSGTGTGGSSDNMIGSLTTSAVKAAATYFGDSIATGLGTGTSLSGQSLVAAQGAYKDAGSFVVDGLSYNGPEIANNLGAGSEFASGALATIGGALSAYTFGAKYGEKYGTAGGTLVGVGAAAGTTAIGGAAAGALGMSAAGAAAGGGLAGAAAGASAALAAIPVWGWAVLAVAALAGSMGGSKGAPKVNFGTTFDADKDGIQYKQGFKSDGTTYGGGETQYGQAIYDEVTRMFVAKLAPQTDLSAFLKGHVNFKGKSQNQNDARILESGEVIYNSHSETGKGQGDWDAVVQAEIPRMRLAIVTEAMKDAGGNYKAIAELMISPAKNLTAVLGSMGPEALNSAVIGLSNMVYAVDQFEKALGQDIDLNEAIATANATIKTTTDAQGKAVTETTIAALGRVMNETAAVAGVFDKLGMSITESFPAAKIFTLSDSFVQLFGTLDGLNQSVGAYYANFYSAEEQRAQAMEDMGKAFTSLNVTMPTTREGFRAVVDGLDLATAGGQATFKAMMDLQDGFAKLVPAMTDVAAATAEIIDAAGRKSWGDKLSVLNGTKTQREISFANDLAGTKDTGVQDLIRQVYALEDAATAAAKALQTSIDVLQTNIDTLVTTFGDVASAMLEINPPAKTLVDSWRDNKSAMQSLQSTFDQFFGVTVPDAGANIQALLTQMDAFKNGASTARSNADNARLQGMTPAERASFWRTQEASLWQGLGNSTDKAGTISKIMEAYGNTRSAELEALTADQTKLNDTTKTGLQTQLEAWQTTLSVIERAKSFAKDLEQFMGSLAFSDLSALNYNDQLAAAGTLYSTTLAGAQSGDVNAMGNYTGNAQSYLEEARAMFGSGLEYANIYAKVTGDASGLGIGLNQDGTQAQSEIDRLTTAISGLTTTIPTAFAQETSDGYIRIEGALTAGADYSRTQMDEQKALLQQQIAQQQEIIANQQAQIEQQAALHAELMAQQAAQTARLTALESNASLAGAGV